MATHKFAVQTTGLSAEAAAQLAYVITHAAHAISNGNSAFACNVPVRRLRAMFPDSNWDSVSAQYRRTLVE